MGIKRNQLCNWPSLRRYIIFQGRAGVGIDTRCRISYPQHGCAAHVETHIRREVGVGGGEAEEGSWNESPRWWPIM